MLIPAQKTGHRYYTVELDPLYAHAIVQQWEQFTGRTAEKRAPTTGSHDGNAAEPLAAGISVVGFEPTSSPS